MLDALGRWFNTALVIAALFLSLVASPTPPDGSWKVGERWTVQYTFGRPNPAAVANPPDLIVTRVWTHEVTSTSPLKLKLACPEVDEWVELELHNERPFALKRAVVWGRDFDKKPYPSHQVENAWGPTASHHTRLTPGMVFLSHPVLPAKLGERRLVDRSQGYERAFTETARKREDGALEITLKSADSAVTFVWIRGERWWAEARSGNVTAITQVPASRVVKPPSTAQIDAALKPAADAIRDCVKTSSSVKAVLSVQSNGTIQLVRVESSSVNNAMLTCVRRVLDGVRMVPFPGSAVTVTVQF